METLAFPGASQRVQITEPKTAEKLMPQGGTSDQRDTGEEKELSIELLTL